MGHPAHSARPTLGVHLHLCRRGSIYYWRRRVTAQSTGNYVLQLSLRTTDLHRARMLARRLTAESDRMLDGFRQATLNPAVASKWLRHVISSELTRVTESRAIIHADGGTDPDADWAMATAWQILARRGPKAELEEDDHATFTAEGRSPEALDQLEVTLSMLSQDVRSDSRIHRIRKAFRDLTGTEEDLPPSMVLLLRQLMIEGNAAAWANVPPVHDVEIAAGMAASMAAEMLQKRREDFLASHEACETGARAAIPIEVSVSPPESKFKVEPTVDFAREQPEQWDNSMPAGSPLAAPLVLG